MELREVAARRMRATQRSLSERNTFNVTVRPNITAAGARAGTSYPGLIGDEADRAYPTPGTPANLQVVAHSPTTCGPTRRTYSDASYCSAPSGAGVFDR
ncbi:hypothetical protein EV651_101488 [Kribbella sp. VKM Ac-2571]|uniref:N,N-dimethylformamidase beta subunit family domain-containing protein n=1 Tax=Kribbella sp. VKM Ac-2571 TaxID=2512222 RepID=UPI0010614559|nr:N,N-dimethylformamidase beta subunit family domain-containing protein [Kribbella sp. VKM Ac-2571]TDO69446.1 hypothetical protein EV651_101488 [Kribbella sp. VKM Ac-2571]